MKENIRNVNEKLKEKIKNTRLNRTKEQKNKMTEREIFKKYDNLSKNELNKKSNKRVHVKNKIITTVIVCCRG